jgi:hypothetical protein
MKVEVNEIIKKEIDRLNIVFQKGAKIAKKDLKIFSTDDYTYLKESQDYFGTFTVPFFLGYCVMKDVEYRIENPYPGTIWYWIKDANKDITGDFLPKQSNLMYDTLKTYVSLLKSENFLQALIIFRSYIEYSSQFYSALLDYDFFQKYTGSELLDEEYKRLWFSTLKPAKVLSKIKAIHTEIDKLLAEKKIEYSNKSYYMRQFRPFDSELRGYLYNTLSGLAHGSYPALVKNDEVKLYSLVWLCSTYLIESQTVIDELTSVYFNYTPLELLRKWVTLEVYKNARAPKAELFVATTV